MRAIAALCFLVLAATAAPAKAQQACQELQDQIVTMHGTVSDLTYKDSDDITEFFVRDGDLPCHADIWVFVQGRTRCADGKKVALQGKFDVGDTGTNVSAYIVQTDADHIACK